MKINNLNNDEFTTIFKFFDTAECCPFRLVNTRFMNAVDATQKEECDNKIINLYNQAEVDASAYKKYLFKYFSYKKITQLFGGEKNFLSLPVLTISEEIDSDYIQFPPIMQGMYRGVSPSNRLFFSIGARYKAKSKCVINPQTGCFAQRKYSDEELNSQRGTEICQVFHERYSKEDNWTSDGSIINVTSHLTENGKIINEKAYNELATFIKTKKFTRDSGTYFLEEQKKV